MKTILKQEHYNNIEIDIDVCLNDERGYIVKTSLSNGHKFLFTNNQIVDIITSMKDNTKTIIVTDSAFEGFYKWYAQLNITKLHELNTPSVDDLQYEIKQLRNELELLKQDVEFIKLNLNQKEQNHNYTRYPNITYSYKVNKKNKDDNDDKNIINNDIIF